MYLIGINPFVSGTYSVMISGSNSGQDTETEAAESLAKESEWVLGSKPDVDEQGATNPEVGR